MLPPNQYHLLPADTLAKIPEMDSRKVYFCSVLNHVVTCEVGEFEDDSGNPAPEFDCIVDLDSGDVRNVVLASASSSQSAHSLQAEVVLSKSHKSQLDSSPPRRSARRLTSATAPPPFHEDKLTSGLSHASTGL